MIYEANVPKWRGMLGQLVSVTSENRIYVWDGAAWVPRWPAAPMALQGAGLAVTDDLVDPRARLSLQTKSKDARRDTLLQRVAHMAAQLLRPMHDAGLEETHYAEFTALRDALLALAELNSEEGFLMTDDIRDDLVQILESLS